MAVYEIIETGAIIPAAGGVDIGCGIMASQSDLVDIVHTLKQAVCVKG
ncbi:MAG: RtcB family protein [Gammaproteobacteria bacterium]|nr:RtcB family protein [Gammaproteobacteria bacterium]